jgi:hypothetical protein
MRSRHLSDALRLHIMLMYALLSLTAQAFVLPHLTSYGIICSAKEYYIVEYKPGNADRKACLRYCALQLPVSRSSTRELLTAAVAKVVKCIAGVILKQAEHLNVFVGAYPELEDAGNYTKGKPDEAANCMAVPGAQCLSPWVSQSAN